MPQRLPRHLWVVRHGESAGNVAREAAHAAGLARIEVGSRDVDVPLSARGVEQSEALGRWFGALPRGEHPDVILASPYRRARQTAEALRAAGGLSAPVTVDERLREKEFGVLDGLTTAGIAQLLPEQAELRRALGKFYHRPPGGESWCDVIFRLRSLVDTVALRHEDQRVLVVAHQVVVLCLRYLLEGMDEERVLGVDREGDVLNASVTEYAREGDGPLVLRRYNHVAPLARAGAPVTAEPDAKAGDAVVAASTPGQGLGPPEAAPDPAAARAAPPRAGAGS